MNTENLDLELENEEDYDEELEYEDEDYDEDSETLEEIEEREYRNSLPSAYSLNIY